ncbi:GIY-YIG nuclease family protein [Terrilactibacillus sp. S3-3]|nr:GIY-YIG nuclease family protein [Terrilactibacillus sp. S3-3]
MKKHTVYILECEDGSYYTGYTTDVEKRLSVHRSGKGAKYTRSHKPIEVIHEETFPDRSSALKREYEIKQLTKQQKEILVKGGSMDVGSK